MKTHSTKLHDWLFEPTRYNQSLQKRMSRAKKKANTTMTTPAPIDVSDIHFTYIPWRTPEWKGHESLGRAKGSAGQFAHVDRWIYHIRDGKFVMRYYIAKNTKAENYPWKLEKEEEPVDEKPVPTDIDSVEYLQQKIEDKLQELRELEDQLRAKFE